MREIKFKGKNQYTGFKDKNGVDKDTIETKLINIIDESTIDIDLCR